MFDPYDIEKDRGPDPNVVKHRVVMNGTWDIPVGHGRKHGANMPGWADALFGGWTVSTLFQARSGNNLTPFFSSFYTTSPWNTGKPLDGLGNYFCCAWRPDQIKDPNTGGTRDAFYDVTAYAHAGRRQARQREEGQPARARHLGRELRRLQGHRHQEAASGCSSRPCWTTRSTTRSSSSCYGDGFAQVDDYLIDGDHRQRDDGQRAGRRADRQPGRIRAREGLPA